MAGDWIKLQCTTPDKPEIVKMAELLSIDQDAVLGKCARLWIWADSQSVDGNALSVTDSFLDRLTYCPGFAKALRQVGWLSGREGLLMIPNFGRHNGQTAKNRALTNDRVKKNRSECNATTVTESLPEKRREEKNIVSNETISQSTPSRVLFAPPSIQDVIDFVLEKHLLVDAVEFCSFYGSKNWMVGKTKMKDWRAAAVGWDSRKRKDVQSDRQKYLSPNERREQTTANAIELLSRQVEAARAADTISTSDVVCIPVRGTADSFG